MTPNRGDRVAIFVHGGSYDRLHQACAIAASATAAGRHADVFFFWYALEALVAGQLTQPSFPGREDIAERFEANQYPSAKELLDAARATGRCTLYACTASSGLVGAGPEQVAAVVDHHVGWATILEVSRGVVDRFYL